MGINSVFAATLSVGLVAAATVNVKPTLPYDSQIGAFNLPLACTLNGAAITLNALISATAPFTVNPGQTLYLQDTVATITVPASAVPSGVSSINTLANADLQIANGSPAVVSVFPGGQWVNGTQVTAGKAVTLRYPSSGLLPAIGPFTAGSSGVTGLFLGALTAKVYTYNSAGKLLNPTSPLLISCPATSAGTFLANLNIQGSTGNKTVNAPSNGVAFAPSGLQTGQIKGYFHTNYVCNILGFSVPVDLVFGGSAVGSYKQGAKFSLGQVTSFLNVGQNWINAAHSLYGATTFNTTVESVQINITNATPTSFNPIATPIKLTSKYQTTGGLNIAFPETGYLAAGPFTASGPVGSSMSFSLGNSVAQLVLINSSGKVVNNQTTTCTPTGSLDLFSVLIT